MIQISGSLLKDLFTFLKINIDSSHSQKNFKSFSFPLIHFPFVVELKGSLFFFLINPILSLTVLTAFPE